MVGERTVEQLGGFTPAFTTRQVTGDRLPRPRRLSGFLTEQTKQLRETEWLVTFGVQIAVETRQSNPQLRYPCRRSSGQE